MTLANLASSYFADNPAIRSDNSKKLILIVLGHFERYLQRPATIADFDDGVMAGYRTYRLKVGRKESTVDNEMKRLRVLWNYAARMNLTRPPQRKIPQIRRSHATAFVRINGRRHYLGPWGTEIAEQRYHRMIAEWLASDRSPTFGLPIEKTTVAELVADYLRHCEEYYGTGLNSELHRVVLIGRRLNELYGDTPAVEFGVMQFKTVRKRLIDQGLSRKWINQSMGRITRMFKWAVGEGRIPPAIPQALALVRPLQRGRTAARETKRVQPVKDAIVDATLPHLPEVVADMVRFHRLTGCRPAEVCTIRPCDIDRSGEVWAYRPQHHKTQYLDYERVIPIGPRAQEILRPYLLRSTDAYCFSPAESEKRRRAAIHAARKTPLMCGNRPGTNRVGWKYVTRQPGNCYNPRSYHNAICDAIAKAFPVPSSIAGDPVAVSAWYVAHHWTPNQLRHSAATEIRKRFGLEAAQVVLGHAQANITQVYAERDYALAASVAKQVG